MMRHTFFLFLTALAEAIAQPVVTPELFKRVNSPFDEQAPVISPDGGTLFFTRSNHPENVGGKADPGDIWISFLIEGVWSAPVHAGPLLNDRAYNAVIGFSPDGLQLFLIGHYSGSPTSAKTQGISVSRKTNNGWSKPENIFIPYFLNKSDFSSGFISSDGNVFVFSAETYGTLGVEDIFVSVKDGVGKWSEPRNAGRSVNTQFQELCPSLSEDGSRLYFSSNGRKGFGSFDIYYCTRLDDTYLNWSEPVNLGSAINSEGRELFFRNYASGGFSIFTSTKNSDGYGDIKLYKPETSQPDTLLVISNRVKPDTVLAFKEKTYSLTDSELRIFGKVSDAKTGKFITARLSFTSRDKKLDADAPADKGYGVTVPSTTEYTVEVVAPNYVSVFEKLDLNTVELKELEMNFRLQPVEVGTMVTLKNILFIQSTPELLPESYPELNLVVEFLKANPQVEIELSGHTDNRGSYRALMELSQKRVNRVKSYLVSKGIDPKRISGKGYGGTKPVASNDNEESRQLNRRVEFTIKKL
ncbi:MAG: OmpA family protein [Flammeovirgaceae bacterium]|nr:MAG: OmpA family protein [Flammeovirgaceae bacterium]